MGVFLHIYGLTAFLTGSSPRAWGCFCTPHMTVFRTPVFPTCVGVFLADSHTINDMTGLPHVRGGVSLFHPKGHLVGVSSPRAWGCFHSTAGVLPDIFVFPTCVGVFPPHPQGAGFLQSLPHVRGGVSEWQDAFEFWHMSSPRAWGCFRDTRARGYESIVFPTCVGVFLWAVSRRRASRCLPHVRGGVSPGRGQALLPGKSSPRAWGCFTSTPEMRPDPPVFPTCVGVFLN